MKLEEDNLLVDLKSELSGIEASLAQVDGLYTQARDTHEQEKLAEYSQARSALLRSRDRLLKKIVEFEAYDRLHDEHRTLLRNMWTELKSTLHEFMGKHRRA